MFSKILIANRGEIAVRIIRACQELGVQTVAVYSQADTDALHAQIADEAICIGPASSKFSYLNEINIISACKTSGAQAIHPGFGFLSENSGFVRKCVHQGITFIGPDADSMDKMGDKATAKSVMQAAGVPVVPGSDGLLKSVEEAAKLAEKIGYPVMIKATAGGGGRGIRKVESEQEIANAFNSARTEAMACFGDDGVYMEKFIVNPRHIEIQILADHHGNVLSLGERDCSVQRRNQKIIEECPSVFLDDETRQKMGEVAVRAAKAVNYKNAGTIEFLVDDDKNFYFMEMNTRIQVEHPVTEMVMDIDLVQQQILIASGKPLELTQEQVRAKGHSIECRICAEDPYNGFRPCPGKIEALHVPGGPGVRIDSAVYPGYVIPPHYDSMIAKLIVHAPTRIEAIKRMRRALAEMVIEGITTNIDYHLAILSEPDFIDGDVDIGFLSTHNVLK